MAKTAKSTKSFSKKHLGAALKQRKKLKPMKNALRRKAAAFRPSVDEQKPAAEERKSAKLAAHGQNNSKPPRSEVSEHKEHLESLKDNDPDFYEFLKEHDSELLDFNDEDDEGEELKMMEDEKIEGPSKGDDGSPVTLSMAFIGELYAAVKENHRVSDVRSLLQVYQAACHYGDGEEHSISTKYSIASGHVFNKIMVFSLCEIDGILRQMLGLTGSAEKRNEGSTSADLQKNKKWKKVEPFAKAYLGNSLHVLNQMTDNEMIAFTLTKLKSSIPFLGAFPKWARKFLKVALHFWGSGDEALSVVSFLFIRELALKLGEDMLDAVLKGIYREYAVNCKFVDATSSQRIQFRANCVVELYGIDVSVSYQLAFVFIRQMAIILRTAITTKTKDVFRSVYCWQYIKSLQLWVKVICMYPAQDQLRQLLYPMVQILRGVAQLVPTARYFPLRLHCVRMLNEMAAATSTFIPVSALLLDMLQFKELFMSATGGVGKAIDFDTTLKVPKPVIRTRAVHQECVSTALEQLAEHLGQWSHSIAFPEMAVIPLLHLRQVLKKTNLEWFCRQVKELVEQIERNVQFVWRKRDSVNFSPKDTASVAAFLESGSSPLTEHVVTLRQRAEKRHNLLRKHGQIVD